jgi:hypothetical protein
MTSTTAITPSGATASTSKSPSLYILKYTLFILLVLLLIYFWYEWHGGRFPGLEMIDWVSPSEWAGLGVAAALGLSVLGAGF